ncbi:MAG TPA: hypothetical protein PKA46_15445 [Ferruginibacter sp.]|nr:hypothetical protein [Ferruginibacter sp.]
MAAIILKKQATQIAFQEHKNLPPPLFVAREAALEAKRFKCSNALNVLNLTPGPLV